MRSLKLGVIILAAGASSRMGRPKLLLPWRGTTVLGHLVQQWRLLHHVQIAVVYAAQDRVLLEEFDRAEIADRIPNSHPEQGMFSSIVCAARWPDWHPGIEVWAIVLGDQPHLKPETLRALLAFAADNPLRICQPRYNGRPRHPVLLPQRIFEFLRGSTATDLREFLRGWSSEIAFCELDDPGLDFDLDRPEDYQLAKETFLSRGDGENISLEPE